MTETTLNDIAAYLSSGSVFVYPYASEFSAFCVAKTGVVPALMTGHAGLISLRDMIQNLTAQYDQEESFMDRVRDISIPSLNKDTPAPNPLLTEESERLALLGVFDAGFPTLLTSKSSLSVAAVDAWAASYVSARQTRYVLHQDRIELISRASNVVKQSMNEKKKAMMDPALLAILAKMAAPAIADFGKIGDSPGEVYRKFKEAAKKTADSAAAKSNALSVGEIGGASELK